MDGNYSCTIELRLQACDTFFFLDYSLDIFLNGIKERKGKVRTDMPWIENEDREVQNIAKKTIEFIKENIQPGMTLLEIRNLCEAKMMELGADSFWYWDVGAFVFA